MASLAVVVESRFFLPPKALGCPHSIVVQAMDIDHLDHPPQGKGEAIHSWWALAHPFPEVMVVKFLGTTRRNFLAFYHHLWSEFPHNTKDCHKVVEGNKTIAKGHGRTNTCDPSGFLPFGYDGCCRPPLLN